MNISGIGRDSAPARAIGGPQEGDSHTHARTQEPPSGERRDTVELSVEAYDLAARADALGGERLARIRGRIEAGAYNDLAVADVVARRMIDAGVL